MCRRPVAIWLRRTLPKVFRVGFLQLAVITLVRASDPNTLNPKSQTPSATACHVATLKNGFTLHYVNIERIAANVRLWMCPDSGSGYLQFASDEIEDLDSSQPLPAKVAIKSDDSTKYFGGRLGSSKGDIRKLITITAERYGVDPDFITSVVEAESNFDVRSVSNKGAEGLMQLMPDTASMLGVRNVFDATENLDGGTRYLCQLLNQYNGDSAKALAAYNAGPRRVAFYDGVPPYRETRVYINRVIESFNRKKLAAATRATYHAQ